MDIENKGKPRKQKEKGEIFKGVWVHITVLGRSAFSKMGRQEKIVTEDW